MNKKATFGGAIVPLLLIFCVLLPTPSAFAAYVRTSCPAGMSKTDCDALYGSWVNWAPEQSACSVGGNAAVKLSGTDVQSKIFNFFVGKGLTPAQTAGIMGNMQAESGFRPNAEQTPGAWSDMSGDYNHAVGLVQWDGGRRVSIIRYLQSNNLPPNGEGADPDTYLNAQLTYIWEKEFNESYRDSVFIPLQATTTVAEATLLFHQKYEVSADDASKIQGRINNAENILADLGGGAAALAVSSGSGACSGGIVAGSIVQTAIGLAWPDDIGHTGPDSATEAYKAAWNGASNMTDCGAFVATVMQTSGVDTSYPSVLTTAQKAYVLASPDKYEVLTDVSDSLQLKAGDILITDGHTMIYLGPQESGYVVADASFDENGKTVGHTPMLSKAGNLVWMLSQPGLIVARVKS